MYTVVLHVLHAWCIIIGQYCSLCDLKFPFKSKLDRHLISEDHIMFANCMQTIEDGSVDADDVCTAEEEVLTA